MCHPPILMPPRPPFYYIRHNMIGQILLNAVGSKNPVKIGAARAVLAPLAPLAQFEGIAVASNVPDQPFGDDDPSAVPVLALMRRERRLTLTLGSASKVDASKCRVACARVRGR